MIDWARVSDLRDEIGNDEFPEVAELFLEEVEEAMARISAGSGDAAEDLHFLKGSALTIGFSELATACAEAECHVRDDEPLDAAALSGVYSNSRDAFLRGLAERGVQVNR